MNFAVARAVANAVMYEGYILYPYRASAAKNRSRWQFGVVMSPGYTAVDPSERAFAQTECILEHGAQPTVAAVIRFLQVQRRTRAGSSWDEAVEQEVAVQVDPARFLGGGHVTVFEIPGGEEREGDIVRRRENLTGTVSVLVTPLPGPWGAARLRVRVDNRSGPDAGPRTREEALPTALVAAHMIIGVSDGAFISMTDPPEWARREVQACENAGCWPVLAGADAGGRSCCPLRSSCTTTRNSPPRARATSTTGPRSTRSSRCARSPFPMRRSRRPARPTRGPRR